MPPAASIPGTRRAPRAGLTARRRKAARDTVAPLPHPHAGKKRLILRHLLNFWELIRFAAILQIVEMPGYAAEGSLAGFDDDSQKYIMTHAEPGKSSLFNWLVPYCSDLRPYLDPRLGYTGVGSAELARHLSRYFQKDWLPEGWATDMGGRSFRVEEGGNVKSYRRVPNSICPVHTWPNGNPVFFSAWEYEKGDVKLTWIHSSLLKTTIILVVHRDAGLGPANPSPEELAKIRDRYFRFPPEDIVVPKGWASIFEIKQHDGRFMSGRVVSHYEGKWEDRYPPEHRNQGAWGGGSWEKAGQFFYDGINMAISVTAVRGGDARTMASFPRDVNWDAEEKFEREREMRKEGK